jgi:SAM-dependent methyltransferase
MSSLDLKSHWYAYIYDIQENQTDDIALLLSVLGNKPKNVLEVCCGTGRILVPLAKAGHITNGFDMDEDMMSMIPGKIRGLKNIRYYKADALKDDWGNNYDVIVMAGNIMINIETQGNYKEAQQLFIKKAAAALRPGGYLYLDFDLHGHPEEIFSRSGERVYFDGYDDTGVYGRYIGCGGTFDTVTQMTDGKSRTEITSTTGEKFSFEKKSQKHIPTLENVHDWLSENAFIVEEEYGSFNRDPIGENTHRAIIYARKN